MKNTFKFLGKITVNFLLISSYYLLHMFAITFDAFANILFKLCRHNGIFYTEDAPTFEKKFSDDQVNSMAKKLPKNLSNLKEIQDYFSISYRQARLVKSEIIRIEAMPTVQGITA